MIPRASWGTRAILDLYRTYASRYTSVLTNGRPLSFSLVHCTCLACKYETTEHSLYRARNDNRETIRNLLASKGGTTLDAPTSGMRHASSRLHLRGASVPRAKSWKILGYLSLQKSRSRLTFSSTDADQLFSSFKNWKRMESKSNRDRS